MIEQYKDSTGVIWNVWSTIFETDKTFVRICLEEGKKYGAKIVGENLFKTWIKI